LFGICCFFVSSSGSLFGNLIFCFEVEQFDSGVSPGVFQDGGGLTNQSKTGGVSIFSLTPAKFSAKSS
jgi:hypothetical protein